MQNHNSSVKISVIDDDESVLDSIRTVLEDQDLNIRTYDKGEAFLLELKEYAPDCIILDSNLPSISGVDVAKAVNKSEQKIPIIILTAYPDSTTTHEILSLDDYPILVKPVTSEILIKKIFEQISSRQ